VGHFPLHHVLPDWAHFRTLGSWKGWVTRDGVKKLYLTDKSISGASAGCGVRVWPGRSGGKVRAHRLWKRYTI